MGNSTTRKKASKTAQFPLFKHQTGYWAKKIKGKTRYFGKISDDPDGEAAVDQWLEFLAGRDPRRAGMVTVATVCEKFLVYKQELLDSGELQQRTFDGYETITDLLVETFGGQTAADLRPENFQALRAKMAKKWGPVRLGNSIQVVRSVFKYGYDAELLEKPVRFGLFKKPSAKVLRQNRTAGGPKMFEPEQLTAILEHATVNMRAMVLLGLNGGLGNTDVAELTPEAFDFKGEWLNYPRVKTATPRRIPLWQETVAAVQAALKMRPVGERLLFVGRRGVNYIGGKTGYRVHQEFSIVAKNAKVEGRTFYDLRRTFQTIGERSKDLAAVKAIMGHAPASGDMSAVYRQSIEDARLRDVVEHVHKWAFPPKAKSRKGVNRG